MSSDFIKKRLMDLKSKTGYPIAQQNGQRIYGPPPNWVGPPPVRGCEVFVGKLPRDLYEDELVPIFSKIGKIYEVRLLMDFSGTNRGYGFVKYTNQADARQAIKVLHNYEIRPKKWIGVVKSVDNCRLYIGGIPKTKTRDDVAEEIRKHVSDVVDVLLYRDNYDPKLNRGFAFVEFKTHRAAAMARRILVPGCVKFWDQEIMVDWAEPEPDIDEEEMSQVKVLYVRNFPIGMSPDEIKNIFEKSINHKVTKVKKMFNYAFVHFEERKHAEQALSNLQNAVIDGCQIEIKWSKPIIDRELYKAQKSIKGNKKFNNNSDLKQLFNYYAHREFKKNFDNSTNDEGTPSVSISDSPSSSAVNENLNSTLSPQDYYDIIELTELCLRFGWECPLYKHTPYYDSTHNEFWCASIVLPKVGYPLFTSYRPVGPIFTQPCLTAEQAKSEAATLMLSYLKTFQVLRFNVNQPTTPSYSCYIQQSVFDYGVPGIYSPPPSYNYVIQQNYVH